MQEQPSKEPGIKLFGEKTTEKPSISLSLMLPENWGPCSTELSNKSTNSQFRLYISANIYLAIFSLIGEQGN